MMILLGAILFFLDKITITKTFPLDMPFFGRDRLRTLIKFLT